MAAEIDEFVDDFDYKPNSKKFDPLRMLRKVEAKGNHAKHIKSFYQLEWQEYDDLLNFPSECQKKRKQIMNSLKKVINHLKKSNQSGLSMYQSI